ncbi:ketopantoate reductase family protein [Candidatus Poriferisocius sp.]|uniref:ketopantoate reductase family protein n=1 Tax=Candidatus Poriferisocius sp. TaxID=3101276 RepID=UPI003B020AF4
MTTVVVLGAGALGSVYGAWFAQAGAEVTLVARPAHAEAVNRRGLLIDDQPPVAVRAVTDSAEAGDCDILLLAGKAFDNSELLAGYRGSARAAFSVQNGVRQAEPLTAAFGSRAVGCVSLVGGTLGQPGQAHHTFDGATLLGDLPTTTPGTAAAIARALPGRNVEVHDDIAPALWSKGVLAAAAMGAVGLTRLVYHRIFLRPETRDVFYDLACECASIASAEGVELIDGHGPFQVRALTRESRAKAHQRLTAVGERMEAAGQTEVRVSILQSIDRGRPFEVQAVFGDLVEIADRHDLAVPVLRTVTRLLTAAMPGTGTGARTMRLGLDPKPES